jgi:hypothetical protein
MVCQAKEPRQVKQRSFAFSASKCVHVNDPSKKVLGSTLICQSVIKRQKKFYNIDQWLIESGNCLNYLVCVCVCMSNLNTTCL